MDLHLLPVVVGYSDNYIIMNDPYTRNCKEGAGEKIVYPKNDFMITWGRKSNIYIKLN